MPPRSRRRVGGGFLLEPGGGEGGVLADVRQRKPRQPSGFDALAKADPFESGVAFLRSTMTCSRGWLLQ